MPNISATRSHSLVDRRDMDAPINKSRWAARFGSVVAQGGVATIPQALFYHQGQLGLSAQEVWFTCRLLADKWDGEMPHTSLKLLARDSGLSLCQIRRIRGDIEAKGYLLVVNSFDDQQAQLPNRYDLSGLFNHLALLIDSELANPNEIQAEDAPSSGRAVSGDWSFIERFGRVLVQRGIATIPRALFTYQSALALTPQQVWFCCYILAHKWASEYPYPSLSKMAERTGYSRRQLQFIQEQLVSGDLLRLVPRSNGDGGQSSNGFDFGGLFTALSKLLARDNQAQPKPPPQVTASVQPGQPPRRRGRRGAIEPADPAADVSREGGACSSQGGSAYSSQGGVHTVHRGGAPGSQAGSALGSQVGGAPGSHEEEAIQEESDQEDSNRSAPPLQREETQAAPYSPYICGVILDYSREFGDSIHDSSNISQAANIWRDSGLGEDEFVGRLHEARKLTRSYQNRQGNGFIGNKMAYFFSVLRSMVYQAAATLAQGGAR